jgi:hypothetical protein
LRPASRRRARRPLVAAQFQALKQELDAGSVLQTDLARRLGVV